jgi:uncharacterized membrane protein YkgB
MNREATFEQGLQLPSQREPRTRAGLVAPRLESVGGGILRYGLVVILFFFGAFKFTAVEAQAIQPLVANSPLMGWLYAFLGVQGVSNLIGVTEIVVGLLIASRPFTPRLSALGSLGAVVTFVLTLSFLASTPGVWVQVPGFPLPVPDSTGAFLVKDLFLLGAAVWSAGEALRASRGR